MDRAGLRYQRHDNCFPWIEDFGRAPNLMDEQLKTAWAVSLGACATRLHRLFPHLCAGYPMRYYWTIFRANGPWTLSFATPEQLRRLYRQLIHLGMIGLSSPDVKRFMDKRSATREKPAVRRCSKSVI